MTVQEQLGQCALRTGAPASRMLFVLTSQARSGSTAFCNSTCPMGASLLPPASARTPLQHLLPVLVARSAKPTPEHHVRGRDLQSAQCESGSPTTAARIHARGTTCRHWGLPWALACAMHDPSLRLQDLPVPPPVCTAASAVPRRMRRAQAGSRAPEYHCTVRVLAACDELWQLVRLAAERHRVEHGTTGRACDTGSRRQSIPREQRGQLDEPPEVCVAAHAVVPQGPSARATRRGVQLPVRGHDPPPRLRDR